MACSPQPTTYSQKGAGVFNLSGHDFNASPLITLKDLWVSKPDVFASTEEFLRNPPDPAGFSLTDKDSVTKKFFLKGGTFYARVLLPEENKTWGLYLPDLFSAYELYGNGEFLLRVGLPNLDPAYHLGVVYPEVAFVHVRGNTLDLLIQAADFSSRRGGFRGGDPIFGSAGDIERLFQQRNAKTLFQAGVFTLVGFMFLLLFLFQPLSKPSLYFSLLSLLIAVRTALMDTRPLVRFLGLPFNLETDLEFGSVMLMVILLGQYLKATFPHQSPKRLYFFVYSLQGVFLLLLPFLSLYEYEILFRFYPLALMPGILLYSGTLVTALFRRAPLAGSYGLGVSILILVGLFDLGFNQGWHSFGFHLGEGFLLFVIFQAFTLAKDRVRDMRLVATSAHQEEALELRKNRVLYGSARELTELMSCLKVKLQDLADLPEGLLDSSREALRSLIVQSLDRLSALSQALLLYTQVRDLTEKSGTQRNFTLAMVLEESIQRCGDTAARTMIQLPTLETLQAKTQGDPDLLCRGLTILLDYIHRSQPGKTMEVTVHTQEKSITLYLLVRGMWLGDEDAQRLFEPFSQSQDFPGGLGRASLDLSLARSLIEKAGVSFSLTQDSVGLGLMLVFRPSAPGGNLWSPSHGTAVVPVLDPPNAPKSLVMKSSGKPIWLDRGLLGIDDEPVNLKLMSYMLSQLGYEGIYVSNGFSGLNEVAKGQTAVILLDLMMPGIDGYQVLDILRKVYPREALEVILVTARSTPEDKRLGALGGADGYLIKPFTKGQIQSELARAAQRLSWSVGAGAAEVELYLLVVTSEDLGADRYPLTLMEGVEVRVRSLKQAKGVIRGSTGQVIRKLLGVLQVFTALERETPGLKWKVEGHREPGGRLVVRKGRRAENGFFVDEKTQTLLKGCLGVRLFSKRPGIYQVELEKDL